MEEGGTQKIEEPVDIDYGKYKWYAIGSAVVCCLIVVSTIVICIVFCAIYNTYPEDSNQVVISPSEPPIPNNPPIPSPADILNIYLHSEEIPAAALAVVQEMDEIIVQDSNLRFIPKWFGSLYKLKRLIIRACPQITSIPDIFQGMVGLEVFVLVETPVDHLPLSFEGMSQLKLLNIASLASNFTLFDFSQMHSLERLHIYNIRNITLPVSLAKASALNFLSMHACNEMPEFPTIIRNLTSLQTLTLEYLDITSIPASVSFPDSIKKLSLSNNPTLMNISDEVHFPEALEVLEATRTGLDRLPNGVLGLPRLHEVYMSESPNLRHIPEALKHSSALRWLEFYYCPIRGIPDWIWELEWLKWINLYGCPIEKRFTLYTLHGKI